MALLTGIAPRPPLLGDPNRAYVGGSAGFNEAAGGTAIASQPGIDQSRLWNGALNSYRNDTPPIFRRSDITANPATLGTETESGNRIGATEGGFSAPGDLGNNGQSYFAPIGTQAPGQTYDYSQWNPSQGFTFGMRSQRDASNVYDYQLDPTGQYFVPGQGRTMSMPHGQAYGPDFWMPMAMAATMGAGVYGAGAGAAAGSAGGAAETGGFVTPGAASGVGGTTGAGTFAPAAGAGGGVAAGSGEGSLLGNLTPTQAIQAGGLLAGAVGGGNRGPQGQPVQRSPVYADPSQGGNQPYQPAPQIQPPQYGSANRPASQIWQQYAQGLFNPSYQPPSVPGVFGMTRGGYGGFLAPQMRPVGMPAQAPQGLLQQPMPNDPRIPRQLPPTGSGGGGP